MSYLNRSCGGCTVCCVVPPVKSPEFSKTSGKACSHCVESVGCAIHAVRPPVCRDWLCGWRSLPFLDDRWRPDKCGLLVVPDEKDIPIEFERRIGLSFVAFRHRTDIEPEFVIDMLAGMAFAKVPTFLSVPGPPGHHFAKALLNPKIEIDAKNRDGGRIRAIVLSIYDRLVDGDFEPIDLE